MYIAATPQVVSTVPVDERECLDRKGQDPETYLLREQRLIRCQATIPSSAEVVVHSLDDFPEATALFSSAQGHHRDDVSIEGYYT